MTTTEEALRAARSASQQVRDDTLRAELVMLTECLRAANETRDRMIHEKSVLKGELADLTARFQCSQLALGQAIQELDRRRDGLTHDGVRVDKAIRPRGVA